MSFSDSLSRTLAALVHPDRRDEPAQYLRHRLFIGARLSISLAALTAAPLVLAFGGIPSGPVALAFAGLTGPLGAAAAASRTGRLAFAQSLHLTGLLGAVAALTLSGSAPGALALLALAPLEAGFHDDRRAGFAFAGIAALTGVALAAFGAGPPSLAGLAAFIAPAALYAAALLAGFRAVERARLSLAAQGEARFELLIEATGALAMGCDRSGAVVFARIGAAGEFGLSARDVAGRGFFERLHILDRPAYLAAIAQAATSERVTTTTARLRVGRRANVEGGYEEPVYAIAELRCRAAGAGRIGTGASVLVVARDVTEAHRRADELEALRVSAKSATAGKDRFLAHVTHELRTPLNAVIGFSDLLRGREGARLDPARRAEYADVIHDAGEHLLDLVTSLLDVSRIEAGRFEIEPETVSLPIVIDQVAGMMRLRAEQGGVALSVAIEAGAAEIVADRRACRQIVTNLLANAIKFTGEGGAVDLIARPEGNSVVVEVIDTGVGIGARDLSRVGDAFFQASEGYDRAHEGTGLGLSLVRGLVGLHGGSMSLESAPGEGTRVSVRLPLDCRLAGRDSAPARIETLARRAATTRAGAASALDTLTRREPPRKAG